ncbi:hypothetical protein FQA39_LY12111 [Lamprigera yunnana]|nr:hypothetical protein FQA39_LY12111 [Lamprigera yunnana]
MVHKEICAGTISGFLSTYVIWKTGKTLALLIGGGIILAELASEEGLMTSDLDRSNHGSAGVAESDILVKIFGGGTSGEANSTRLTFEDIQKVKDVRAFLLSFFAGIEQAATREAFPFGNPQHSHTYCKKPNKRLKEKANIAFYNNIIHLNVNIKENIHFLNKLNVK